MFDDDLKPEGEEPKDDFIIPERRPRLKGFNPKKIFTLVIAVIALIIVGAAGLTSYYTVSEQERAVVTTFGRPDPNQVYGAGLHFKIPFVQNVHKVDVTTRGMEIGYQETAEGEEVSLSEESVMITKDFNFVLIDFYIEWKVSDPIKFLYNADAPQALLGNIVQSSARSVVSAYNVDEVLTTAKTEIQATVRDLVSEKLLEYDMGISISNITVQDAEPPTDEIISAFKDVENAKQQMETEINKANQYANTNIPFARSEADRLKREAESLRDSRILEAQGQVARFNEMFQQYQQNTDITKTRMYLEAMEEILPDLKVVIEGNNETLNVLNLDTENTNNAEVPAAAEVAQ